MRFSKIFGLALILILSVPAYAKDVSAYFSGEYKDKATVTKILKDAGFEIVATYNRDRKGKFTTVIFTSPELQKLATAKTRGFFAVARAYINQKDNEIRVTNTNYFGHAFLGDDYSADVHNVTDKIVSAFGDLKPTSDILDSDDLAEYHFSFGMPYYEDMIEIEADKTEPSDAVFSLKLSNGSTLVGLDLSKRNKRFVRKAGRENGILLPYTALIEDGKVKILDPKYYLAISYPNLSMGDFMKIASVPDAIETDITRQFK